MAESPPPTNRECREMTQAPTPRQLHGLVGVLIAGSLDSGVLRQRVYPHNNGNGIESTTKKFLLMDWLTSIDQSDAGGIAAQTDERVTASIRAVAHRFWNLRIRMISTKAYYTQDDPSLMEMGLSVDDLFDSVPLDYGTQTTYSFDWSDKKVFAAKRDIRPVPFTDYDGPSVAEILLNPPSLDEINTKVGQMVVLAALSEVSFADVRYLRRRIEEYREDLYRSRPIGCPRDTQWGV